MRRTIHDLSNYRLIDTETLIRMHNSGAISIPEIDSGEWEAEISRYAGTDCEWIVAEYYIRIDQLKRKYPELTLEELIDVQTMLYEMELE